MSNSNKHDPIYSPIYAASRTNFSFLKGGKDRSAVFGCNNDRLFQKNIQ